MSSRIDPWAEAALWGPFSQLRVALQQRSGKARDAAHVARRAGAPEPGVQRRNAGHSRAPGSSAEVAKKCHPISANVGPRQVDR